ncbi:MAG TPA: response regulator [Nannocystaceae bacterium]|nr:response regulator [Nannocystaceae bacterium]
MTLKILIVDDEFCLAEILADILAERGYETIIAINGKHGLERLLEHHADLVLLDVMMPIMDGPTMLRRMRAEGALADIPVVMMTAVRETLPKDDPPLHQAALIKPFHPDAMLTLVARLTMPPR